MESLAQIIGLVSGLRVVHPEMSASLVVMTGFAMLITLSIVCRIFASSSGRDASRWALGGFFGGIFALALLLILTEQSADRG